MPVADKILEAMWYVNDMKGSFVESSLTKLESAIKGVSKRNTSKYVDLDGDAKELGAKMITLRKVVEARMQPLLDSQKSKKQLIEDMIKEEAISVAKNAIGTDPVVIIKNVSEEFLKQATKIVLHACAEKQTLVDRMLKLSLHQHGLLLTVGELLLEEAETVMKQKKDKIEFRKKQNFLKFIGKTTTIAHEAEKLRTQLDKFEAQVDRVLSGSGNNSERIRLIEAEDYE